MVVNSHSYSHYGLFHNHPYSAIPLGFPSTLHIQAKAKNVKNEVTKIIMPRGSNHATLNEGDLVVMYCIQNGVMVDWTYTIRDHMMKAKRLTDFKLAYVVLISKFIEHFGVDVEGELEESTRLLNHVSTLNMPKMGFTKIEVGAHDHKAGTSGGKQEEDEPQAMAIELYNLLENTGPAYSQFERMVLNQLQDLNMAQNAYHAYCTTRFQDLDDQLHNVHNLLFNVYDEFKFLPSVNV